MTMDATFLEATKRVAHALRTGTSPRLKKRRRAAASAAGVKALKEAGVSERDARILMEGDAHERRSAAEWNGTAVPAGVFMPALPEAVSAALRTFQEEASVGDGTSGQLSMPPMTGWRSEGDSASVYSHAQHGTVRLHGDRWTHHVGGRIVKSGVSQESLGSHLRGLVGDTGNSGAADANAEALAEILGRVRGETPRPTREAARLVEALTRTARAVPTEGDLHSRLRRAVTR